MESRCNKKENACEWKAIIFLQQRNRKNSHCCLAGGLFKLWLLSWKTLIPQLNGFLRIINDEFTYVHGCLAVVQTLSYLVYVLHNTVNIEIKLLWSIMLGCNLALNTNQSWNNFWCHFKIPPMSQSCYLVLPVGDTTTFLWPPVIKYHPINCNQVSIQKGFIYFIYLFVYSRHEVHSMNTHTLQNAGWKNRQYRTEYRHWSQRNHRVTDSFCNCIEDRTIGLQTHS